MDGCINTFMQGTIESRPEPDFRTIPEPGKTDVIFHVPILMYHTVNNNENNSDVLWTDMTTSINVFEKQLELMDALGYTTISLDELTDQLENKIMTSRKQIVLTFDDGYSDFYSNVYPLILKHHMKAVVFIPVNYIGKPKYLTWDQVKEMSESNAIIFESHSLQHYPMTCIPPIVSFVEIFISKVRLQLQIKNRVNWFSYPYGLFDTTTIDLLKLVGYKGSVTTVGGTQQHLNKIFVLTREQGKMMQAADIISVLNAYY